MSEPSWMSEPAEPEDRGGEWEDDSWFEDYVRRTEPEPGGGWVSAVEDSHG